MPINANMMCKKKRWHVLYKFVMVWYSVYNGEKNGVQKCMKDFNMRVCGCQRCFFGMFVLGLIVH